MAGFLFFYARIIVDMDGRDKPKLDTLWARTKGRRLTRSVKFGSHCDGKSYIFFGRRKALVITYSPFFRLLPRMGIADRALNTWQTNGQMTHHRSSQFLSDDADSSVSISFVVENESKPEHLRYPYWSIRISTGIWSSCRDLHGSTTTTIMGRSTVFETFV